MKQMESRNQSKLLARERKRIKVPMPGNPNFQYVYEDAVPVGQDDDYEEKENWPKNTEEIELVANALEEKVQNALRPFYTFTGMVASAIGAPNAAFLFHSPPNQNGIRPIVKRGASTFRKFVIQNEPVLGRPIMAILLLAVKGSEQFVKKDEEAAGKEEEEEENEDEILQQERQIEARCFALQDAAQAQDFLWDHLMNFMGGGEEERVDDMIRFDLFFAPPWVWACLPNAVFRSLLQTAGVGAFDLALSQVRRLPGKSEFTMHEMICSDGVNDRFAILVASNLLLASGGNAYPSRIWGNTQNRRSWQVSAGLATRTRNNMERQALMLWFRTVYRVRNTKFTQQLMTVNDGQFIAYVQSMGPQYVLQSSAVY
jgi:hypothetical protein